VRPGMFSASAHRGGRHRKGRDGVPAAESPPLPDPQVPRCPYPDMLRSNPRCGAPGTTPNGRPAPGGPWPGETRKVEENEDSIRARHSEAAKGADRPQPKGSVGRTAGAVFAGGGTHISHRAIGSNLPVHVIHLDQLGKPHGSRLRAVSRPQGRGTGQGVKDVGESESRPVIGRIGQYPSRKGADFRRVSAKRCFCTGSTT
jgi:hypothetical protein